MAKIKNIEGRRFGKLVALKMDGFNKWKKAVWLCRCDCGNTISTLSNGLIAGRTKSCGCYQKEVVTKHGVSRSPEYIAWKSMISRCRNSNDPSYKTYGGAGVDVCDRWIESVNNFIEDMGARPSLKYSVDRIDNSKGYSKENCRWATMKEQQRNRTNNRIIEFNGISMCIAEWCELLGLKFCTLDRRLKNKNFTVEQALTMPLQVIGKAI